MPSLSLVLPGEQPDILHNHMRYTGQTATSLTSQRGRTESCAYTGYADQHPTSREWCATFFLAPVLTLHGDLLRAIPGPIQPWPLPAESIYTVSNDQAAPSAI